MFGISLVQFLGTDSLSVVGRPVGLTDYPVFPKVLENNRKNLDHASGGGFDRQPSKPGDGRTATWS
jgi:hypothetical protein